MKTTVNRKLQGGVYYISFAFTEFTPDELEKMGAFGIPVIEVQYGVPPNRIKSRIPLNQIGPHYNAGFFDENEAKTYEQSVLNQVRAAMEALRKRKDDFSSSEEVAI